MLLKKILLGVSVAMLGLTANAQTINNMQQEKFSTPKFNRTLGLNDFRNLPDAMLQKIGERTSANGYPARSVAKQMLAAANAKSGKRMAKASAVKSSMAKANYVASDTLLWESFEGWDEQTMPWIPVDKNKWNTRTNIADLTPYVADGMCPTWTSYRGDGFYLPYAQDGDNMLVCMYATEPQDEWLVSPTISGVSNTNYLSFDICYAPWDTHYFVEGEEPSFDMSRVTYDVDVLVTTSTRIASFDEATYTNVYKLSELVDKEIAGVDFEKDAEVGELMYMKWRHVQIPLADFAGKGIRVAFRYTGMKGGTVLIDGVRVSDLLPVAMYDIPKGSFYYGFSETADLFNTKIALVPAYKPLMWQNYSNTDSKTYAWSYFNNGESATSTDENLVMPAQVPARMVDMPVLTSSSDNRKDSFNGAYYKVGGNAHYSYQDENVSLEKDFYVGNFDPTKQYWLGQISANGTQNVYAFGTGGGAFYGQLSNYHYNAVDGIGNFYEAPDSPYVFDKVLLPLGAFFNLGATLACTIYKVENGNTITDEVIAQATLTDGTQIAGGWFLVFNFNEPIVVDDAIFVMIDGFSNNNLIELAPLSQALNHDSEKSYAFVKLNTSDNSYAVLDVANLLSAVEGGGNMMVSHCIGMNAVFPYVQSLDGDVFAAANEGETKSFAIDSYWDPNKDWKIETSGSWISAEPVVDQNAQTVSLSISAEALPAEMEGRYGTVTITALGCKEVITVLQGSEIAGIEGIVLDEKFNTMDGTYTLSGQRINTADAKHGIFLVKKNGKFVKVLK